MESNIAERVVIHGGHCQTPHHRSSEWPSPVYRHLSSTVTTLETYKPTKNVVTLTWAKVAVSLSVGSAFPNETTNVLVPCVLCVSIICMSFPLTDNFSNVVAHPNLKCSGSSTRPASFRHTMLAMAVRPRFVATQDTKWISLWCGNPLERHRLCPRNSCCKYNLRVFRGDCNCNLNASGIRSSHSAC